MKMFNVSGLLIGAFALAACASSPGMPPPPPPAGPDLSEPAASAAPAKTILYTDCIAQAIGTSGVARVSDGDTNLLRFTCTGAPAQRFYEALAVMGEAAGTVWQADGRTFRATARVQKDLFGVDYCSAGPGGAACRIVLNTGEFLTSAPEGN